MVKNENRDAIDIIIIIERLLIWKNDFFSFIFFILMMNKYVDQGFA